MNQMTKIMTRVTECAYVVIKAMIYLIYLVKFEKDIYHNAS